ncbi:MAG: TonB-dependent receptor domain-containing protein [Puniceicoccaceae bacterium]
MPTPGGVEALLEYDPARQMKAAYRVPVRLAFTWTEAKIDGSATSDDAESIFAGARDGNRIPYIPEFQFRGSIGFEVGGFTSVVALNWTDSVFTSASNSSENINPITGKADARFGKLDSFTTVDVGLGYQVNEVVRLFGFANNVFDEEYATSRLPHGLRPGAPRSVGAGVEILW